MTTKNLTMKQAGYIDIRQAKNGVKIGIMRMNFTYALCYNVNLDPMALPYEHRYCYPDFAECFDDFVNWSGYGNPEGNWIKKKGSNVDEGNMNYVNKPPRNP